MEIPEDLLRGLHQAYESIYWVESQFGTELRQKALEIARERVELRKKAQKMGQIEVHRRETGDEQAESTGHANCKGFYPPKKSAYPSLESIYEGRLPGGQCRGRCRVAQARHGIARFSVRADFPTNDLPWTEKILTSSSLHDPPRNALFS